MKKYILILVFLLSSFPAMSQYILEVTISPDISPFLGDWFEDTKMITVRFESPQYTMPNLQLVVTVTGLEHGEILESRSSIFTAYQKMAVFFHGRDLITPSSVDLNSDIKSSFNQSNRLPDDNYTFCVEVYQGVDTSIATRCVPFFIRAVNPPILLQPTDNDTINIKYPFFQWTPVRTINKMDIKYRLKVCRKKDFQTPEQAMLSCTEQIFFKQDLSSPNTVMTTDAVQLEDGGTYIWQVEVYDKYGNPLGDNNGKSEIFQFTYHSLTTIDKNLKLDNEEEK
jgi:hypothetical protein